MTPSFHPVSVFLRSVRRRLPVVEWWSHTSFWGVEKRSHIFYGPFTQQPMQALIFDIGHVAVVIPYRKVSR